MNQQELTVILYQALAQPIGLLVECSDWNKARQQFYRARTEAKDPELAQLQFRASPGIEGGNLIIVKQRIAALLATVDL